MEFSLNRNGVEKENDMINSEDGNTYVVDPFLDSPDPALNPPAAGRVMIKRDAREASDNGH